MLLVTKKTDRHINQIIKVREWRTVKEAAAALLLLNPFRIYFFAEIFIVK